MSDDRRTEIIPPSLPVLYVPPAKYTDRTSVFTPIVLHVLRTGAVLLIEWTTLNYIENAPLLVRIATFIVALLVLAVLECRDWLNFKRRHLFTYSISVLIVIYVAICGYAFAFLRETSAPMNPAMADLQTKLAAALRERDIAISERDAAMRDRGDVSRSPPIPSIPQSLKTDEIEARIEAWKSVDEQMGDLARILSDGDDVVNNWESVTGEALSGDINKFRQNFNILHNRLSSVIAANNKFSDLEVIDVTAMDNMNRYLVNLLDALGQTSNSASKVEWETAISPYIGPVKREIASLRQWLQTTKNIAGSSILELTSRQRAGK